MFHGLDMTRVPARRPRPATLLRVASFSAPESGHGEATAAAAAAATETSIASRHALDREEERRGGDTRFVGNRGSSEPEILTAGAKEFNSAQPALQPCSMMASPVAVATVAGPSPPPQPHPPCCSHV